MVVVFIIVITTITILPLQVAAKCDQSTCSLLTTCLTTPEDAACTIATTATSLPAHVTALSQ